MFPLSVGSSVEIRVRVGDSLLIAVARVVTSDPQVGNGIQFLNMVDEDREELRLYVEAAAKDESGDTASTITVVDNEYQILQPFHPTR